MINYKKQLIELFEHVSGCQVSEFSEDQLPFLVDYIIGQHEADSGCIEKLKSQLTTLRQQNAELVGALSYMLGQFGEPDGSDFINEADYLAVSSAKQLLQKIKEQKLAK